MQLNHPTMFHNRRENTARYARSGSVGNTLPKRAHPWKSKSTTFAVPRSVTVGEHLRCVAGFPPRAGTRWNLDGCANRTLHSGAPGRTASGGLWRFEGTGTPAREIKSMRTAVDHMRQASEASCFNTSFRRRSDVLRDRVLETGSMPYFAPALSAL